jgi:adhesin transport system outer membrane protein
VNEELERDRAAARRNRGLVNRRLALVEEARVNTEPRLDALSARLRRTRDEIDTDEPAIPAAVQPDELTKLHASLAAAKAELDDTKAEAERNAAESQIVRMITRAEAEGERERRVEAEQAAERASAERGAAREALAEARARLEDLERHEGALAARVREERQRREELQVRLAAIARATQPDPSRADELDLMERRLVTIRDELQV